MPKRAQPIPNDLLDALLADRPREEILANDGLIQQLAQQLIARSLSLPIGQTASMPQQKDVASDLRELGPAAEQSPLTGKAAKGRAIPQGLDTKIMAMYSKGLTPREIQEQVLDFYG